MTEAEFDAWILRTADGLSEGAARLYLRVCDEWVEVDDMLGPDEDEVVMAGLASHVRGAGSRQYFLQPEVSSRWALGVQRILQERYPDKAPGSE